MVHGERATATGAWALTKDLNKIRYNLDKSLASGIAELAGSGARVLDVGAGKGRYVDYLRKNHSLHAVGVDGIANIEALTNGLVRHHDLTRPFEPCAVYPLVMCLEVGEHIPWKHQHTFLSNLNCSVHPTQGTLVLSWAPPGQFGSGHINNRDQMALFSWLSLNHSCAGSRELSTTECDEPQHSRRPGFGFLYDWAATAALRARSFGFFRSNLMVFRRPTHPAVARLYTGLPAICRTSMGRCYWSDERSELVERPFCAQLLDLAAARRSCPNQCAHWDGHPVHCRSSRVGANLCAVQANATCRRANLQCIKHDPTKVRYHKVRVEETPSWPWVVRKREEQAKCARRAN